MDKDVIYIDVEDDITAIVGKIKTSKQPVVALVPPKRIGILQSAVNLRLLARAAKQADKRLAIITSNASLSALAANASIPVARNLQSQPELAEVAAISVDEDDDVIDGGDLPVGEHIRQTQDTTQQKKEERSAAMAAALAQAPKGDETPKKPRVKGGSKVPSFDKFRKKLIIIILLIIGLIGFLVWAFIFAPRATVIISAKTTSASVNVPIVISPVANTDARAASLKAVLVQEEADKTQQFTATGQKDAGSKATGTVTFSTDSISVARRGVTIPAGSAMTTRNGQVFYTNSAVSLSLDSTEGSTAVTAAENGSAYNAASGSVRGAPNGVSAALDGPTSGGVSRTVTIVTAEDVQKARGALVEANTDEIKQSLKQKFQDGVTIIDESFAIDYGDISSSPAIGEEASQGTLTAKITYTMLGVSKAELEGFLKSYNQSQLSNNEDQRVYDDGVDDAIFQEAKAADNGATATLIATAKVGPKIEEDEVKELAKGKRYGEIQQTLEAIRGVDAVDVKFFPFWVSTVPNDTSRVTVDFNLEQ